MNQKKSKALRKSLRAANIDPREASYDVIWHFCGDPRKPYLSFQNKLQQQCGRAIYQRVKRIGLAHAA